MGTAGTLQAQADAATGQARYRVMLLTAPRLGRPLRLALTQTLEQITEVVPADDFERQARERGLDPRSVDAFDALLAAQRVDLVVVAALAKVGGGRRALRLTYLEGQAGMEVLEEEHRLIGRRLQETERYRIVAEAGLALNAVVRMQGSGVAQAGTPPPELPLRRRQRQKDGRPPSAFLLQITGGLGMGTRAFSLPGPLTPVRLDTALFPAAGLALQGRYLPRAQGRLSWLGAAEFWTSMGLNTRDARPDGTVRDSASRAQRLELQGGLGYRLGRARHAPVLEPELAWAFRFFSADASLSLPDFSLSGPLLRLGLQLPMAAGRLWLGLSPELQWLAVVDGDLKDLGVNPMGATVGWAIEAGVHALPILDVALHYRESHALLGAADGEVDDIERFVTLQARLRP